jgi:hypothetical protein
MRGCLAGILAGVLAGRHALTKKGLPPDQSWEALTGRYRRQLAKSATVRASLRMR